MTKYKQALLLREDLDMSTGKMIAQACHASLKAYRQAGEKNLRKWEEQGEKKVALAVDEETLVRRFQKAKEKGLASAMVTDAGKTEIKSGTKTAAAIGPDEESKIDTVTGDLKLIK